MASKSKQDGAARQQAPARENTKGAPVTALARARLLLAAGNVQKARAAAEESLAAGPEAEKVEARALLARTQPDPRSLLTAAGVLLLTMLAAWAAILRLH